jgi:hypothetical protein
MALVMMVCCELALEGFYEMNMSTRVTVTFGRVTLDYIIMIFYYRLNFDFKMWSTKCPFACSKLLRRIEFAGSLPPKRFDITSLHQGLINIQQT